MTPRCRAPALAAILLLRLGATPHCVDAYVTSGLPGKKHRAWLKRMTSDICASSPGDLSPEMLSAAPELMAVWANNPYAPPSARSPGGRRRTRRSAKDPMERGLECALAVEGLLKRMVDERQAGNERAVVTTGEYNVVLHSWANSGKGGAAAQRAEQILIQMHDRFTSGDASVQPDLDSFKAVIRAWSAAAAPAPSSSSASPDREVHAPHRAQRVLEWMAELGETGANDRAVPDADCFDAVLRAWAASGRDDAPERAEVLLRAMDAAYPSANESARIRTRSLNEALVAWGKSSRRGAPDRADEILRHMERLADAGHEDAGPNLASYTTVASSWAKVGGTDGACRAEGILRRLEKRYRAGGNADLRPDTAIYNICLDAWAKAQTEDSYRRARSILDRQLFTHRSGVRRCAPDVYSYSLVLNACASTPGPMKERTKAFDPAWQTFQELCKSDGATPNHVAYGTMLKACSRLLPRGSERRERCARDVFVKACRDGCVGHMVLDWLQDAVRPDVYEELLGEAKEDDLPPAWRYKVPQENKRLQKKRHTPRRQEV